jgi:sodium transport system permease protein
VSAQAIRPPGLWFARVVYRKEMLDHLRDRRSLVISLIYPLMGPLVFGLLLALGGGILRTGPRAEPVTLQAAGLAAAPGLEAAFARHGIGFEEAPADELTQRVRQRATPVAIEVRPDPAEPRFFTVRVIYDQTNVRHAATASRVVGAVHEFSRERGRVMLSEIGVDPRVGDPGRVIGELLGGRGAVANALYNLIPPLVIFMIFLGGVYLAIDTTAGERERGSLEPLLAAPIRRWELLLGKAAAAFAFTTMTVVVNLVAFRAVLGWIARPGSGFPPPPDWEVFARMFLVVLPLMALAVALQFLIAAATRSMKEAQIYLGLLPIVPAMPGMVMSFAPVSPSAFVASVPVLGQLVALVEYAAGREPAATHVALASVASLALTVAIFVWSVRLYEKERQVQAG